MKTLCRNVPLDLGPCHYEVDVLLGCYTNQARPAIILVTSRPDSLPGERAWEGVPVAIASALAPEEYLQHTPDNVFAVKNYAENIGLWEQLVKLTDDFGDKLFLPTWESITLGFAKCQLIALSPFATRQFVLLRESLKGIDHETQA